MKPTRTHVLTRRRFLFSTGLSIVGAAFYTRFLEPGWPVLSHHQVPFFKEQGSVLRILHLSDLHYSDVVPLDYLEKTFRMGLEQKPDLVCLTGDYKTGELLSYDPYVEAFKILTSAAPVVACLGNHDYAFPARQEKPVIPSLLREAGIHLLTNELETLSLKGRRLQIAGLGDLWTLNCHPQQAFQTSDPSLPTLVLSHNPDSKKGLGNFAWNLMLCGHSHGGQVKIPFYGAIHAPIEDFAYIEGLNAWRDRWIYTTRGVGNLCGIRFNCRPEVAILDLV